MIKLSNSAVMLIRPDGTQTEFDADELQSGIIRSCLAAGSRDLWMAEDIALSIEYALTLPANRERVFTLSEINSLVIKILEETGNPEVAEAYRRQHASVGIRVNPDRGLISELIQRHLGLSGNNLAAIAERVVSAAERLEIAEASPTLFVELAKLYKEELLAEHDAAIVKVSGSGKVSPWLVSSREIAARLSPATRELEEAGVIVYSGLSRMFPALKLDFRITRLVGHYHLSSPLTEMAIIPRFGAVAAAMNEIVATVNLLLQERHEPVVAPWPVYLLVNDMSVFACTHLLSRWPEAEPCCREMLVYLREMLDFGIFKATLK